MVYYQSLLRIFVVEKCHLLAATCFREVIGNMSQETKEISASDLEVEISLSVSYAK